MTIRAFIANGNTYTFPTLNGDQQFNAPFASIPAKITKLPGASGGFDENGMGRGASDPAIVEFTIVLTSDTRAGMQLLRDSLRTMAAWGKGRLIDTINGVDRWCWARIVLPDIKEQRMGQTDLHQPVKLTFSVSDPYWYTVGNSNLWGGFVWGTGKWGGTSSSTAISSSGTITITNNGSADTLAKITIGNTSGSTVYNPRIQRIVNGSVRDELFYNGSIATATQLMLDPKNHTALLSLTSVLANLTFKHPEWMRLLPGSNSLLVNVDGAVGITVQYYERYV